MKILDVNPVRQLLRCPRCNELIGALSQECRYCHRILNTTEIRAGIERYERAQQEESARKDRRALRFSIISLLGSIALGGLWVALKFLEVFRPGLTLAIAVFIIVGSYTLGKILMIRRYKETLRFARNGQQRSRQASLGGAFSGGFPEVAANHRRALLQSGQSPTFRMSRKRKASLPKPGHR